MQERDRQTYGQTVTGPQQRPRLRIASRGKNYTKRKIDRDRYDRDRYDILQESERVYSYNPGARTGPKKRKR